SNIKQNYNLDENDVLFLHVGRFNEAKNQMFLLNTINELKKRNNHLNFKLFLVGDYETDYGMKCINYVEKEQIKSNNCKIIFTGVQSNISDYFNSADIFLFPSMREGLPGALIESTMFGKVSIASDIEPNIELYNHFPKAINI